MLLSLIWSSLHLNWLVQPGGHQERPADIKVSFSARLCGTALVGSLDNENSHWLWACLFSAVICPSPCVAFGWVKDVCVSKVWLQLCDWAQGHENSTLSFSSASAPQFRTNGLEIFPVIASATPNPVPPGFWGQKAGHFLWWAHSPEQRWRDSHLQLLRR